MPSIDLGINQSEKHASMT